MSFSVRDNFLKIYAKNPILFSFFFLIFNLFFLSCLKTLLFHFSKRKTINENEKQNVSAKKQQQQLQLIQQQQQQQQKFEIETKRNNNNNTINLLNSFATDEQQIIQDFNPFISFHDKISGIDDLIFPDVNFVNEKSLTAPTLSLDLASASTLALASASSILAADHPSDSSSSAKSSFSANSAKSSSSVKSNKKKNKYILIRKTNKSVVSDKNDELAGGCDSSFLSDNSSCLWERLKGFRMGKTTSHDNLEPELIKQNLEKNEKDDSEKTSTKIQHDDRQLFQPKHVLRESNDDDSAILAEKTAEIAKTLVPSDKPNKFVSESFGEKECRIFLEFLFGRPFPKLRPSFLSNSVLKNGRNLEIDCFNSFLRLGLEYHGRQHYEFVPYFHKNKLAFQNQQYRDYLKKNICQTNKIFLIEVPFYEKHIKKFILNVLCQKARSNVEMFCRQK